MALSHKDWELTNARIWLAEMDINRGLDFPIQLFWSEKLQTEMQNQWLFSCKCQKADEEKSKEDE